MLLVNTERSCSGVQVTLAKLVVLPIVFLQNVAEDP